MKQLVKPVRIPEIKKPNHIAKQAPLLDDGRVVMAKTAKQKEAPAQKKTEQKKKKKLGARQLFTALTFVMMITALMSQASVLIGCAKTAVETLQKSIPTVTIDSSTTVDETLNNDSYGGGMAPLPTKPDAAVKSVPETKSNDEWRNNESFR